MYYDGEMDQQEGYRPKGREEPSVGVFLRDPNPILRQETKVRRKPQNENKKWKNKKKIVLKMLLS